MEGEYLRVAPDELARAVGDPAWAQETAGEISEAEANADLPPDKGRRLSTHKAWHAIAFLLERADFPVSVVYGEEQFPWDGEWGYGPPRYLTPDRVLIAAGALAETSFDTLTAGVSPSELDDGNVYPHGWDADTLEWVRGWYEPLIPYFTEAARQGQAVLVWLA